MTTTVADTLAAIGPYLPEPLVAKSARMAIAQLAQSLPQAATPVFGFECPLATPAGAADFLTHHPVASGVWEWLGQENQAHQAPTWALVRELAQTVPRTPLLAAGLDDVWLEFDVATAAETGPSLFFGPRLAPFGPQAAGPAQQQLLLELIAGGLTPLGPAALPAAGRGLLRRVLALLPHHGRVFQVGRMLSRPQPGYRLCLNNLTPPELYRLYARLLPGYHDLLASLRHWLRLLAPLVWKIRPTLDLANEPVPKIGLECYFREGPDLAAWQAATELLVRYDLCQPAKQAALLHYPRLVSPATAPTPLELLLGQRQTYALALHHFKLSLAPQAPLTAKAYLAVKPRWQPLAPTLCPPPHAAHY